MASTQVQGCIRKVRELRFRVANESLNALVAQRPPFEGPTSGITPRIEWRDSFGGRLKQLGMLPIVLPLILFLLLATPFFYVGHLRKISQAKAELRKRIARLRDEPLSIEDPEQERLDLFWALHGMKEDECSFEERLQLLSDWIDILYGPAIRESLQLRERTEDIARKYGEANRPYYEGQRSPHFHFMDPLDAIVRQLSAELPPYNRTDT